ncbi:hypothetical protein F5X68DRAFT_214515 [Plectosphaerella plurivora]|uniref:DUF7735 domain-containing protein n=1 Tax=Plectosphaerella plurivora TaxID=936078 RepID=A0A9P8V409_9PEZI|nr:hypothetical protein F5X68DRAFT_214515 [Plectosphaerella plurivora]
MVSPSIPGLALLLPSLAMALDWDSTAHEVLFPKTALTQEPDPPVCNGTDLDQFFDVPERPSEFDEAMESYVLGRTPPCTASYPNRCFPDKDWWCGVSSVVPQSVLSEYSSYGSAASSWWEAQREEALENAALCPHGWREARWRDNTPITGLELNLTIIYAACYAEMMQAGTETTVLPAATSQTSVADSAQPGSLEAGQGATATLSPDEGNGGVGREATGVVSALMAIVAGITVMNSIF